MNIHAKEGDIVVYTGASDDQIRWGSNDDPRGLLELNRKYIVDHTEIHSWHTEVILKEFPDKKFNSVSFEDAIPKLEV